MVHGRFEQRSEERLLRDRINVLQKWLIALVLFMLGNATAYVTFGMGTARQTDLVVYEKHEDAAMTTMAANVSELATEQKELIALLKGRKLIDQGYQP